MLLIDEARAKSPRFVRMPPGKTALSGTGDADLDEAPRGDAGEQVVALLAGPHEHDDEKPFRSGRRAVGFSCICAQPSMLVACSGAGPILLYGTPSTYTSASRTTNPRVSVTRKRPVNGARDRITVGSNCTCEMTSRFRSATLEAGIDVSPPGRRIAPAGLPGGSGFVRETTTLVGRATRPSWR